MTGRAEQIAAVLAEHEGWDFSGESQECSCGCVLGHWSTPHGGYAAVHRAHVAAAVDAALAQNSSPAGSPAPTMDPSERANGGLAVASRTGTGPAGEVQYILVQPGLDGVAWLGELIDGEPSPIGKVDDILRAAAQEGGRGGADTTTAAAVEALAESLCNCINRDLPWHGPSCPSGKLLAALSDPVGALANHDAEVWDEGYAAGVSAPANRALGLGNPSNPYRADHIEGNQT